PARPISPRPEVSPICEGCRRPGAREARGPRGQRPLLSLAKESGRPHRHATSRRSSHGRSPRDDSVLWLFPEVPPAARACWTAALPARADGVQDAERRSQARGDRARAGRLTARGQAALVSTAAPIAARRRQAYSIATGRALAASGGAWDPLMT